MRSEQHSVAILRFVAIRGYFPAWLFEAILKVFLAIHGYLSWLFFCRAANEWLQNACSVYDEQQRIQLYNELIYIMPVYNAHTSWAPFLGSV